MSESKYTAGVSQGVVLSANGRFSRWPWPAELPGLGAFAPGQFSPCIDCPPDAHPASAWTFVSYGGRPLCSFHARKRRGDA